MKKLGLACVALLCAVTLQAQTPEFTAKMKQMLELSGANATIKAMPQYVLQTMQSNMPALPDSTQQKVKGLLEESFTELMELMVPIYAQFYTEKDMDELIAFYESPIGRKLAASQPQITQQTMLSLQGWTAQFAQKLAALLGTQATDSSASESEQ